MKWLLDSALGVPRYVWAIGVVCAVAALGLWFAAAEREDDKINREIGVATERQEATAEVLQRTEQGNEARENIQQAGPVGDQLRYNQCVRSARNPEVCQRFLSQ